DKGWQPAFPYQANTKGGILRTVFQAAYKSGASLSAETMAAGPQTPTVWQGTTGTPLPTRCH
ncbi:MAG: hypothetical protein V8R87_02140, partial [Faecalibacterium prausnitzii]